MSMTMLPTFQMRLKDSITTGQATVGKFDGKNSTLACGTTGGKVFVHNPHLSDDKEGMPETNYININRQITAVTSGALTEEGGKDYLCVGTNANVQAYDVERNRDLFYREIGEGVTSLVVGRMGRFESPMAFVGGSNSIQGFDMEGDEAFWTVTGDAVLSMDLLDLDGDGHKELVAGSRDYEIRVFRNEDIVATISEADHVTSICALGSTEFGYSLANGTVGVYDRGTRRWRVKSKHMPTALAAYDLDGDGVNEIVAGWDNGRVEVRNAATGDVFFRTSLQASLAGLLVSDLRRSGNPELVALSTAGEVRGFSSAQDDERVQAAALDKQLADLNRQKQDMLYELSGLETSLRTTAAQKKNQSQWSAGLSQGSQADLGESLPVGTVVKVTQAVNRPQSSLDFIFSVNNGCCIKGVVIIGEGLFEGTDSLFHQPSVPTSDVVVPLVPARNIVTEEIVSRVLVATSFSSTVVRAFELRTRLPRLCMFSVVREGLAAVARPTSYVTLAVNERVQRFGQWMESRFQVHVENLDTADTLEAVFQSLRDGTVFVASMGRASSSSGAPYELAIYCDDMDLAGDLVQDICDFMEVSEGQSRAVFPREMESLRGTLQAVEDANALRMKMQADTADSANLVKALVVKAEDSRLLRDVPMMRRMYHNLMDVNRDLIMEHTKRTTNQDGLLEALKKVNAMIQRAAKLRRGKAKAEVVSACRTCIKNNNFQALFRVVEYGVMSDK